MALAHRIFRHFRGPRTHLTAEEKDWIENRWLWLMSQFGDKPVQRSPLDPASDLLPRKWDHSQDAGNDLFERLCRFMLVDPARIEVRYYSKGETHMTLSAYAGHSERSGPAGLYYHPEDNKKMLIALESSGLERPAQLAATICHELGHVHLLADARISREETDSEPLTDLLTVYFGTGIFTANAVFQFNQWQSHSHQGWSASRLGYLSEQMLAMHSPATHGIEAN